MSKVDYNANFLSFNNWAELSTRYYLKIFSPTSVLEHFIVFPFLTLTGPETHSTGGSTRVGLLCASRVSNRLVFFRFRHQWLCTWISGSPSVRVCGRVYVCNRQPARYCLKVWEHPLIFLMCTRDRRIPQPLYGFRVKPLSENRTIPTMQTDRTHLEQRSHGP